MRRQGLLDGILSPSISINKHYQAAKQSLQGKQEAGHDALAELGMAQADVGLPCLSSLAHRVCVRASWYEGAQHSDVGKPGIQDLYSLTASNRVYTQTEAHVHFCSPGRIAAEARGAEREVVGAAAALPVTCTASHLQAWVPLLMACAKARQGAEYK